MIFITPLCITPFYAAGTNRTASHQIFTYVLFSVYKYVNIKRSMSGVYVTQMMTTDFRSVLCHLFQRHHTHLSAADRLQPDTALLQSSAQLSVVRFLPSLLGFCQLSMVMIHLCPVISLKLSRHNSKCCSNCKIPVCFHINVQDFVWFQSPV